MRPSLCAVVLATSSVALCMIGCDRPRPSEQKRADRDSAKTPSDISPEMSASLDLLFGAFNYFRLHGDWVKAISHAEDLGGKQIDKLPSRMMDIPEGDGVALVFADLERRQITRVLGINTKTNSASVMMLRTTDWQRALAAVQKKLKLRAFGSERDIGQECRMYSAWLDAEPLAVLAITYTTSETPEESMVSVGLVDWRTATAELPELAKEFSTPP